MRLVLIIVLCFLKAEAQSSAFKIADSLYAYGKYSDAITHYKNLPETAESFEHIAKSYNALGNYTKSISYYNLALKEAPNTQLTRFQLAKLYAQTKAYNDAKFHFLYLIDLDYKNPVYHYELGLVYLDLDDDFAAQSRLFSAYELDSTNQKVIYQLAKFHFKKNNEKTFLKYVEAGLELYPENKGLLSLKAQYYFNKDNYKTAVIQFEKLLNLNEDTAFVNEKLSWCYEKLYQDKKAISALEKTLTFEPNNSSNLFRLARLFEREEQFEKAESYYKTALKLEDQPLDKAYINLGIVLNRQNKHKEALQAFKRADYFKPNNDYIHFLIANTKAVYYADYESKIAALEQFKIKFPKSVFIKMVDYKLSELKREEFHREK